MWAPKRPKRIIPRLLVGGLILVLIASIIYAVSYRQHCPLRLKNGCYQLDYATTEAQRVQGLSGRSSLAANRAMLFVLPTPGRPCFWMKDMKFNIDIIFMDKNKKVNYIVPNASPSSYPTQYCALSDTKYVLEIAPQAANGNGILPGQQLDF